MSITISTNLGDLKIEIFCDLVPKAAENFLALCASDKYIGTTFHRNIKGFMIQGGDPTGRGTGGESIWGGYFPDEFHPTLMHDKRGIVSMANSGPDTNGSQFFITYTKLEHLDRVYTVIGQVIDHFETLDIMERVNTGPGDRPVSDITITKVKMHANPMADMAS